VPLTGAIALDMILLSAPNDQVKIKGVFNTFSSCTLTLRWGALEIEYWALVKKKDTVPLLDKVVRTSQNNLFIKGEKEWEFQFSSQNSLLLWVKAILFCKMCGTQPNQPVLLLMGQRSSLDALSKRMLNLFCVNGQIWSTFLLLKQNESEHDMELVLWTLKPNQTGIYQLLDDVTPIVVNGIQFRQTGFNFLADQKQSGPLLSVGSDVWMGVGDHIGVFQHLRDLTPTVEMKKKVFCIHPSPSTSVITSMTFVDLNLEQLMQFKPKQIITENSNDTKSHFREIWIADSLGQISVFNTDGTALFQFIWEEMINDNSNDTEPIKLSKIDQTLTSYRWKINRLKRGIDVIRFVQNEVGFDYDFKYKLQFEFEFEFE
jgi:predicted phosphatase